MISIKGLGCRLGIFLGGPILRGCIVSINRSARVQADMPVFLQVRVSIYTLISLPYSPHPTHTHTPLPYQPRFLPA